MIKKIFIITTILFINFFIANAKTGVIEIIMKSSNGSDTELITVQAETDKFNSIILVSETGKTISKTIKMINQKQKIYFDLPAGKYQLITVDVEIGLKQKHIVILQ